MILTSTNKVYGGAGGPRRCAGEASAGSRWTPRSARHGIAEERPLDFSRPYGCSKGAADQYVLDYARSYGLPTMVLPDELHLRPAPVRQRGPGLGRALSDARPRPGRPLTYYGDGAQVRDVLYVDDLVEALLLAERHAETLGPRAYNIGGGPANAISLLELLRLIERLGIASPPPVLADWRPADQRYYVSDSRRFQKETGWRPRWTVERGLESLMEWLASTDPAYAPRSLRSGARAGARRGGFA